mgnify:CR=1 FL=1
MNGNCGPPLSAVNVLPVQLEAPAGHGGPLGPRPSNT